jgi:hypothetical protein
MVINSDFEISYLLIAFALLGAVLVGDLLNMQQLQLLAPQAAGCNSRRACY